MDVSSYSDEDLYELWAERAAVFEFDGGLSCEDAEYLAGVELASWVKVVPERIRVESSRSNKKGK